MKNTLLVILTLVVLLSARSRARAQKAATVLTSHSVQARDGHTYVQSGSGTVIARDDEGFSVLSCAHVVEKEGGYAKGALHVTTAKGKTYRARVLYYDKDRDLSLMRVTAKFTDVAVAVLAEKETYEAGLKLYKCGHPGGGDFEKGEGVARGETSESSGFTNLLATAKSSGGDSGGGVYRKSDDALIGVVWGGKEDGLRAVRLKEIKDFLAAAKKKGK